MTRLNLGRLACRPLVSRALRLMSHLEQQIQNAHRTFGGGTALMLRIGHRQSKDIDLFVPDPQYLGYVNPRLSDIAESISVDYEEATEYIKLFLPSGVRRYPLLAEPSCRAARRSPSSGSRAVAVFAMSAADII
jgi:hypothetical protein